MIRVSINLVYNTVLTITLFHSNLMISPKHFAQNKLSTNQALMIYSILLNHTIIHYLTNNNNRINHLYNKVAQQAILISHLVLELIYQLKIINKCVVMTSIMIETLKFSILLIKKIILSKVVFIQEKIKKANQFQRTIIIKQMVLIQFTKKNKTKNANNSLFTLTKINKTCNQMHQNKKIGMQSSKQDNRQEKNKIRHSKYNLKQKNKKRIIQLIQTEAFQINNKNILCKK
ncbi:transmembrane protein, putative (macronuclear) [Tetrahymena thermophila SB210]|uniref:Transmembrane protein, putative n=1 Tax=Tetrahymena thermophila (strain SB210) TaxID=312017 RepID=W7XJL8_TETTS|nr:transmembrane protein, putative [Tetrahymena thermophila SB210]EWS74259.1 transmembrane protein, putative [Tetrahymena thermophila SB210]|eukprot:XP_012653232.1 transmembrane protein, putative [Tetrahymena thermophila SB210]